MAAGPRPLTARVRALLVRVLRDIDIAALPPWQAVPVRVFRVVTAVSLDLVQGNLSMRATGLVYTTLLSLVPLLAISFSVLKGFGVHNQMEPLLLNLLGPLGDKGAEITERIIEFVERTNVGVLGSVGLALLLVTVISLMRKVERAFNFAWRVTRARPLTQRFSSYVTVIVIGPVLVFSAMGLTASLVSAPVVGDLAAFEPVGKAFTLFGKAVPFLLVAAAFTFIYVFLPNTRVRFGPALAGGLVAGVLWEAMGWAFASFVVTTVRYTAIYSAFAALIFFLLWLYVSWLILLVGASLAFYVQNPHHVGGRQGPAPLSNRTKEALALELARQAARAFTGDGPPATVDGVAARLGVANDIVESLAVALQEAGLLARTADDPPRLIPARPPAAIPLKSVLDAARADGEAALHAVRAETGAAAAAVLDRLDGAAETALADATLESLAREPAATTLRALDSA